MNLFQNSLILAFAFLAVFAEAALDAIEEVYDRLEAERNRGPNADQGTIGALDLRLKLAIDHAQTFVVPNEYSGVIEENGGVGLNAGTALDSKPMPEKNSTLWRGQMLTPTRTPTLS